MPRTLNNHEPSVKSDKDNEVLSMSAKLSSSIWARQDRFKQLGHEVHMKYSLTRNVLAARFAKARQVLMTIRQFPRS